MHISWDFLGFLLYEEKRIKCVSREQTGCALLSIVVALAAVCLLGRVVRRATRKLQPDKGN